MSASAFASLGLWVIHASCPSSSMFRQKIWSWPGRMRRASMHFSQSSTQAAVQTIPSCNHPAQCKEARAYAELPRSFPDVGGRRENSRGWLARQCSCTSTRGAEAEAEDGWKRGWGCQARRTTSPGVQWNTHGLSFVETSRRRRHLRGTCRPHHWQI